MTTPPLATKTTLSTTAINTKPLAAVVADQTSLNATKPVQNQGTADTHPGSNNPPQGFDGPSPNLPGVSKASADSFAPQSSADKQASVEQALGLVSQSAALQSLSGLGTSAPTSQSQREKLTDLQGSIGTNQSPGFDQGFDSKPAHLGSDQVKNGNPMADFQGASAGGLLTAGVTNNGLAATTPGSGAAGSGLVSDVWDDIVNFFTGGDPAQDNAQSSPADGKETAKGPTSGSSAQVDTNNNYEVTPTAKPPEDKSGLFKKLTEIFTGTKKIDGSYTTKGSALNAAMDEIQDQSGNTTQQPGGGAKMPDPENTGANVKIVTQSLLDQLNAAQTGKPVTQGGSGDATPVTEGGSDPVVRNGSFAVNEASLRGQNLFGQPGGSALGENLSGGDKGLNGFSGSNGAGVINPGNEAGTPAGDPRYQQDPGQALGDGKPATANPSLDRDSSQETTSSSVSSTLAAGIRNLTLTGTAAINGSGNSLDNLIIGNMAANELRGEGGNDTLDGKGGNDLLEGGAGQDQLTGGSGADRFRFATGAAFGAGRADRITDFSRSEGDRIEISRSAFGLGTGATVSFQAVSSDLELSNALSTGTLLVQDQRDGSLLFNQNGSAAGAGLGGLFATVNPELTLQASDFGLIG